MAVVSIIVPIYNAENYLNRCVDSLRNQTLKDIEVVLVDDGSKDSSGAICDQLAQMDSRIKAVHISNGGVSNARNVGIKASSGEYLSFVDSDDWMDLESYELLSRKASETGADVVYCDYAEVYGELIYPHTSFSLGETKEETIRNMINFGPRGGNIWNFIFIRRNLVIDSSLSFPGTYKRGEDFWFTLHTHVLSTTISKVEKCLYYYDLSNTGSATHNEKLVKDKSYLSFMDDCIDFLKIHNYWQLFEKEIQQRILLEKTIWAVRPSCFKEYLTIHPEANKYLESNPFIGSKMKLLMNQINQHHLIIASCLSIIYRIVSSVSHK